MNVYFIVNYSDEKIVKGCKKRKRKYQMALYDGYAPALRAVCLRYVKNDFDADEVLQEGFIKIFNNIHRYKSTGSLYSWLKRVMVNNAIDFCRKRANLKYTEYEISEIENNDDEDDDSNFSSSLSKSGIQKEKVFEIIKNLPDGYRMVLNLYVMESYSHKEISEKLGISVNTSKSQLSRARKTVVSQVKELLNQVSIEDVE